MSGHIDEQVALYGQPLSTRFGALLEAYGITQRRLAEVLGLSAPMLSQLMRAQRTKIGNPAVYERLLLLEARMAEGRVGGETLEEVAASEGQMTTSKLRRAQRADSALSEVPSEELVRALLLLGEQAPTLGSRIREALASRTEPGTTPLPAPAPSPSDPRGPLGPGPGRGEARSHHG